VKILPAQIYKSMKMAGRATGEKGDQQKILLAQIYKKLIYVLGMEG